MKLKELQGINRASLMLAISYLKCYETVGIEELDKCEDVVADYLYNNGLKFNFKRDWKSMIVPHRITLLASRTLKNDYTLEEAVEKLGGRVRLKCN